MAASSSSSSTTFTLYPLSATAAFDAEKRPYKVVHLVRHAQGTHNLAVLLKGGVDGGVEDEYKSWEWHDARLTDTGKEQASGLRPFFDKTPLDLVITSPLSRTVQTALLAIPAGPKFVAIELVRERCGTHPCDKRRSRKELEADFPTLDTSLLTTEEDTMWKEEREPMPDLIGRANTFLDVLRARPEGRIAVVTHNDFLKALFFESRLHFADPALRKTFTNAECLSVALAWEEAGAASSASSSGAGAVASS